MEAGDAYRTAVGAACDAEDAADALEQKLIVSLSAGLELVPELAHAEVERAEDPRLSLYQRAALRRMARPADSALALLVSEDLEAPADDAVTHRLRRALPLLDSELAGRVRAALGPVQPVEPDTPVELVEEPTTESGRLRRVAAELRATETARHDETRQRLTRLAEQWASVQQSIDEAQELNVLDPSRRTRRRQTLESLLQFVSGLRREIRTAVETSEAIEAESRELREEWRGRASGVSSEAFRDLEDALRVRRENLELELSELLSQLERALVVRRQHQSIALELARSREFVTELSAEIESAPLWLQREWSEELRSLRAVPGSVFTVDRLVALLWVSFDLLLLIVVWMYLRRASVQWLRRGLDAMRQRERARYGWRQLPRYVSDSELKPIGRHGTDAIAALALHYLLLPRSELLAFAALVWLAWVLAKSIPPAFRLLLVVPGRALDPLTGLDPIPEEVEELGAKTARWFVWWWIVSGLLRFIAVPLLQADRMQRAIGALSWMVFAVIFVYALGRWSPWLRRFIADLPDQNRITEWLGQPIQSWARRLFRAGVSVFFIAIRFTFWLLVDLGWVSRAGTSLVVSQLQLVGADTELLPEAERDKIRDSKSSSVPREKELATLVAAFDAWRKDPRRGMVAVTGDRGMGKTVFLEQVKESVSSNGGVTVELLPLPRRTRSKSFREQLSFLTEPLGIELSKGTSRVAIEKTIIDRLEAAPPGVFLVDDAHLLMRRAVGGFELLQSFFDIVQSCSDEHFWVLTLHRPAWTYFQSVSRASRLAFREHIALSGLDPEALETSLVARTRSAGYEPQFEKLLQRKREQMDQETAESKARSMYWRIVSQASLGNPLVALDYWLSSLGPTTNGSSIPIYLFSGHSDGDIEKMSDEYLFLLTALVVHDGLRPEDLGEVLNVPVARARMACQHLEGLNVLTKEGSLFQIAPGWQPAVLRVLDRKNFAHR